MIQDALFPQKSSSEDAGRIVLPESHAQAFTLKNGLVVLIEEDHSAPVASVQAWCATGSVHEGRWLGSGLSHFLEHMLFKGTDSRKGGEIARQVQNFGGYINAYTSFDRTVYWIDSPSDGAAEAIEILADATMNSLLPVEEYAKEQEVIRREFAMGFDDPNRQSSQLMLNTVFTESPLRHPVIGYLDVFNKLQRDDLMEYYRTRYAPNNMAFVIVGDVDTEKTLASLERLFEKHPRRALDSILILEEPAQMGARTVHEEFPTELSRLSLAWRIPNLFHPDTAALDLLGDVLGSGRSSVLHAELREGKQLAHFIHAGKFSMNTDGVFVVGAVTDPDKREQTTDEALRILDRIRDEGVTQWALDRARKRMVSSQLGAFTTMRGKASDIAANWHMARNINFTSEYLDAISRVTVEDIRRVANLHLRRDTLNLTSLNPIGRAAAKRSRTQAAAGSEVTKFTLPNGLRVLVREDSRVPLVSISAAFRGGTLAETAETNGVTKLLASALVKGSTNRSASQLADEIESVGGRIDGSAGNNLYSVSVSLMKPDIELGFDILSDVLIHPAFQEEVVALEKSVQIASIKAEDEHPTSVARNLARQRLFGGHPYGLRHHGDEKSVSSLDPQSLRTFHETHSVAKNGVLSVFGDVDATEVRRLAEKYFGPMMSGELRLENAPKPEPLSAPVQASEERDKQQAVIMIGFPGVSLNHPDRPVLEIINEASNNLASRFFDRIREKLGLAYFVGASHFSGLVPGCFIFYLGTDPLKADAVLVEMKDEISLLAREGLTEEEFTRAKKKILGGDAIHNQDNARFGGACAGDELLGLGYDHYLHRPAEIGNITLDDVKRVASNYFDRPECVEILVGPNIDSKKAL